MTIIVHEWDSEQRCKRCCIPKDMASKPQFCPGKPPSARQAARMRWPLDGATAQALEGALSLTERERDELQAKLDAELPAAWREDLASLNECLERVGSERDKASQALGDLLAIIHRDGGHHTAFAGMSQSVADAHAAWGATMRELDEARAETDRLRAALRAIADGFDMVAGSLDDPSAKQLDGYYRGFAAASLEKGDK